MENENKVADTVTTPIDNNQTANETKFTEPSATPQTDDTAFSVKFNHQTVGLSKDEAVKYAQQGMLFEKKFSPILDKLGYLAELQNKSPQEVLDTLIKENDGKYREQLEEKFGKDDPIIEDLMAVYKAKAQEKFKNVKPNDFDTQFKELQSEFPSIEKAEDLPTSVLDSSEPLLYAYLKYLHSEAKKVERHKQTEKETDLASAGSVYSAEVESDLITAFLKGIEN